MTKFTAKLINYLRTEIVNSRKIYGKTEPTFQRCESLLTQSKADWSAKRKHRDILHYWNFVNQGRFYNFKIKMYKKLLNKLEGKVLPTKERLTDSHFNYELKRLVEDAPEPFVKTKASAGWRQEACWVDDEAT